MEDYLGKFIEFKFGKDDEEADKRLTDAAPKMALLLKEMVEGLRDRKSNDMWLKTLLAEGEKLITLINEGTYE